MCVCVAGLRMAPVCVCVWLAGETQGRHKLTLLSICSYSAVGEERESGKVYYRRDHRE